MATILLILLFIVTAPLWVPLVIGLATIVFGFVAVLWLFVVGAIIAILD